MEELLQTAPDSVNTFQDLTSFLGDNLPAPSIDWSTTWKCLPILPSFDTKTADIIHRLNSYGSLFYFIKVVLQRHRLTEHLHHLVCTYLEQSNIKLLLELPRDHFKSTICSEGAPIWWALPFNDTDASNMEKLGYSTEWLEWMRYAHNQDTRTLLVSANILNSSKLGKRIAWHYTENLLFRKLFKEIIPTASESWNIYSMTHKRSGTRFAAHGEGTYDFLGIGAALQSRHYPRIIEDDPTGREALNSDTVMQDVIDYHRLLVGAFEAVPGRPDLLGDNIVVTNRWKYEDLGSHIREFEPEFKIISHSAEGGCCPLHPPMTPIFPEDFSMEKLRGLRSRLGDYLYSCQFLNSPIPPGEAIFKKEWLRYYDVVPDISLPPKKDEAGNPHYRAVYHHDVYDGKVIKNVYPTDLQKEMIVDPNHAGKNGRCRHAIVILGFGFGRMYLLDVWAESAPYDELIRKMFQLGEKFKIRKPHIETIAFQKFLKYHLEVIQSYRKKEGKYCFDSIAELKTDFSEDAKAKRIEGMSPTYSRGEFWVPRTGAEAFIEEYSKYPHTKHKDVLDTIGYGLQFYNPGKMQKQELENWLRKQGNYQSFNNKPSTAGSITGY